MYNHFSAYGGSIAGTANTDTSALLDTVLQSRNSHLIMSEPFNVLAMHNIGLLLTRSQFNNVGLTYRSANHMWPLDVTVGPPAVSRAPVMDRRHFPLALPMNEEITIGVSMSGVGPTQAFCGLWLQKPEATLNLPPALDRLTTRATSVVTAGSLTTWNNLSTLTFERDLFNGVYCVIGANVVSTTGYAYRFFFPSQRLAGGRQLRPGGLLQNGAVGVPWPPERGVWGEWGRFHTFEPPSIQVAGDPTGGTYEIRLDLLYLGQDIGLLRGA